MKLSFSLSSKPSSAAAAKKTPQSFSDDHTAADSDPKPEYVTVFDSSKPLASSSNFVIPPLPNSDFRGTKRMKNLIPHPDSDEHGINSETHFVLDTSGAEAPSGSISYGLTVRDSKSQQESKDEEARDPKLAALRRFQDEIKELPEDRGMEEFTDVSVEKFAAAILGGYGWKEGKGIGRGNEVDTKVVQYDRLRGKEGLGYHPSSAVASKRKDEKVVRVISGKHMGLKGKIIEKSEKGAGSPQVVILKLLDNGEEVRLHPDMIAELGSREEEKCLRKLEELDIHGRGREKGRDRRKEERRSRDVDRDFTKSDLAKGSNHGRKNREKERGPLRWLKSHIRVRVISKDFKGGKWYLKKGEVVDVVSPTTCDLLMDGSGELVQGVDQEILETAIPKRGGSVLVLYGRHEGVYGSLEEWNTEKETGVVRDADSHALINVRLEQIAEYVGDMS